MSDLTLPASLIKHRNKYNRKILSNLNFSSDLLQLIIEYAYSQRLKIQEYICGHRHLRIYCSLSICVINNHLGWCVNNYYRFHKRLRIIRIMTSKRNQRAMAYEVFTYTNKYNRDNLDTIKKHGRYIHGNTNSAHIYSPIDNYTYSVSIEPYLTTEFKNRYAFIFRPEIIGQKIVVARLGGSKTIYKKIIPHCVHYTEHNFKKMCKQVELYGKDIDSYSFQEKICKDCATNIFLEDS